jgi:hypothetical protein
MKSKRRKRGAQAATGRLHLFLNDPREILSRMAFAAELCEAFLPFSRINKARNVIARRG